MITLESIEQECHTEHLKKQLPRIFKTNKLIKIIKGYTPEKSKLFDINSVSIDIIEDLYDIFFEVKYVKLIEKSPALRNNIIIPIIKKIIRNNEWKRIFFEKNYMTPYLYDHMALRVLTNRPRNIVFYSESNLKLLVDQTAHGAIKEDIGAFIVYDKRAKEYFSKRYPIVTDVGIYKIFWTINDLAQIKKLENKKILKSRPPEHMVNFDFGKESN